MQIRDFLLERYFAGFEFSVPHHLSASDCESMTIAELFELTGESADALLDLRLGYTESAGDPALREAIAAHYPDCDAAHVLVTNAPEEAVFLAMLALLKPGDRVVAQTPCYQSLVEVARSIGCEIIPWALRETADSWQLDLDELQDLLAVEPALLVVNAPHNPTGHQPSGAAHAAMLELAATHGVRVFSDEMYRGLEPDGTATLPPAASRDPRALSLWGTSKSFGLPGLRIGWLVCRDDAVRAEIGRLKDYTTICSSAPGEVLTRIALQHADRLVARNRAIVAQNTVSLRAFAARWPDQLTWLPPMAGPVSLARIRTEPATAFCDRARVEAGVLLVPSKIFDMDDCHVRFGLGRHGFDAGITRLDALLATQ